MFFCVSLRVYTVYITNKVLYNEAIKEEILYINCFFICIYNGKEVFAAC